MKRVKILKMPISLRKGWLPVLQLAVLICVLGALPVYGQDLSGAITLEVSAGFDGYFRQNYWLPIKVDVANDGPDLLARLVVRPETSGSGVNNTFSLPISLPTGSRKTTFLYITAQSYTQRARVELLNENNVVYAAVDAPLRTLQSPDRLYAVVTTSPTGTVDLSSVSVGGYRTFQASWVIANLPDRAGALDALDVLMFSDIDTGSLSSAQRSALADWVASGGHLIVTGGQNWQQTAAGLRDMLPLLPETSQIITDLSALTRLAGANSALRGQAVVAIGPLVENAQVLASTSGGLPLVSRRMYGGGTVDYLAVDPSAQALRHWAALPDFWFTLITTSQPAPTWTQGFTNWDDAINAIEILPGVNLLPEVLALCSFLGLYIALVGPLNYLVLNRLNRREWAWVTIPVLIVLFSGTAWLFGFNLRGSEVLLSQLSIVQSWTNSDRARVDQLIGLLSPLRANYSLSMSDDRMLRPISRSSASGIFGGNTAQSDTDIRQTDVFSAQNFPVDASFVASYNATGTVVKPDISGTATIAFADDGRLQKVRGSVRNNSQHTLTNPVILMRGVTLALGADLAPGDIRPFEGTLSGEGVPQSAALEPPFDLGTTGLIGRFSSRFDQAISVKDILTPEVYRALDVNMPFATFADQQEARRRRYLLQAFMVDTFNSPGRGNRVFLAGWTNSAPLPVEVEGALWTSKDSTLYLVELAITFEKPPANQRITLSPDQFMWVTHSRSGVSNYTGPFALRLIPGDEVAFRFSPLPGLTLARVDEILIRLDQNANFGRLIPVSVWNWQRGVWVDIRSNKSQIVLENTQAYLGPQNAVQLKIVMETTGGYLDVGSLAVEQTGSF